MRSEIVRDVAQLTALEPRWRALWLASATRPVTLHPAWIDAWWTCLGGDGELVVVACSDGDALVGVAPFYLAPPRGVPLRGRELRLIGDGVVGARRAVLGRAGAEPEILDEAVAALARETSWDVLDLALGDGDEARELGRRFAALGRAVEQAAAEGPPRQAEPSGERHGEAPIDLLALLSRPRPPDSPSLSPAFRRFDGAELAPALERLLGLLRAGSGPTSEAAFVHFVARATPALHRDGAAFLVAAESDGRMIGGALVLRDGARAIEMARSGDRSEDLTRAAIELAASDGAATFEIATARARGAGLRVYGPVATAAGASDAAGARGSGFMKRGYASLVRKAGDQIERLRVSAPEVVQRVVARVATFSRLHLYRGELFVRGGTPPTGARLRLFQLADFEAHPDRAGLVARLGLVEDYCRQKWERGDTVVLAELDGQAAGIVWCARVAVQVPDIGREVRPLAGQCYIHDVYVSPEARGRALAPSMLDFLARELRARDVYRGWALIERTNTASTRAFEKAAYASVADVIYARMGGASKLLVRPPDEEARAFLGLPPRRAR